MKHPLVKHTKVRVLIPALKPCGSFRKFVRIDTSVVKWHDMKDGSYMYTVATGDLIPQKNMLSVI